MERTGNGDPKTQLVGSIRDVNKQIGGLFNQRRQMGGRLQPEGIREFAALHLTKNRLLVDVLELRRQGENSIAVELVGREEDALHQYSRNHVDIVIGDVASYKTSSRLDYLRRIYTGNIVTLIGQPDRFTEESCRNYIIRTVVEMNEIGDSVDNIRYSRELEDFMQEVTLGKLKIELAKRLLRLRVNGEVTDGELTVSYLRDRKNVEERDLIEIEYILNGGMWGSHIVLDEYRRSIALQNLIDQGGGFDSMGRRKKHY